ncbi:hypothetical protein ACEPAH_4486 [Sanghuangporus vaninii]
MATTLFVTLRMKPDKDWQDILPHILASQAERAACSGYSSYFFDVVGKSGEIAVLTGWKSEEAHSQWLSSETNKNLNRSLQPFIDVTSLLHLTIRPSQSWSGVKAMVYEKLAQGSSVITSSTLKGVVWEGQGNDAHGKVQGTFKLVALNSLEALDSVANDNDEKIVRLVRRHDIPLA